MIRPRKTGYKDLPENLHYNKTKRKYIYRHPTSHKQFLMGPDKQNAIDAANYLNSQIKQKVDLVDKVLGTHMPMAKWVDHFETVILPSKKLAENTVRDYKNQLKRIKAHFKNADISMMTVLDISKFLDILPPVLSNRTRSLMITLFKYAIAKGYCDLNIAEQTMPKSIEKKRQRLSLDQFNAILNYKREADPNTPKTVWLTNKQGFEETPHWLKIAMKLALETTQRINEISKMRYSDIVDNCLRVTQQKTGAHLEIEIFTELQIIINDSRDNVLSPFIVHKEPVNNRTYQGRQHYTQCKPEYISKCFAEIRDRLPAFQKMKDGEKPTFHEIRSLGIHLYEEQGEDAQLLAGHKDRKMTEHYKKGHESWTKVKVSGLKL